jgi:hypothetical protein
MVMVRATSTSESGKMPDAKLLGDMMKFNQALLSAGVMLAGDGLKPSSQGGARVRFSKDDKRTVVDGPFAETKELIAGYWIWKVKSREEALEWMGKCPSPFPGEECVVEMRQVFEPEDFGAELTAAMRELES